MLVVGGCLGRPGLVPDVLVVGGWLVRAGLVPDVLVVRGCLGRPGLVPNVLVVRGWPYASVMVQRGCLNDAARSPFLSPLGYLTATVHTHFTSCCKVPSLLTTSERVW